MEVMGTAAAAERLGMSDRRVRQLADAGVLDGVRVGRDWALDAASVEQFAQRPAPRVGRPRKGDGMARGDG